MLIRLWSVSTGVTAVILGCLVHPHVARDAFISLLSGCCSSHLSPPTAILMTSNYFYFSACRSKRCCSGPGTEGPKLHRKLWRCWLGMYKHKGLAVKLRVLLIFHWYNHVCCVFFFVVVFSCRAPEVGQNQQSRGREPLLKSEPLSTTAPSGNEEGSTSDSWINWLL